MIIGPSGSDRLHPDALAAIERLPVDARAREAGVEIARMLSEDATRVVLVHGPTHSGKTQAAMVARAILDPSGADSMHTSASILNNNTAVRIYDRSATWATWTDLLRSADRAPRVVIIDEAGSQSCPSPPSTLSMTLAKKLLSKWIDAGTKFVVIGHQPNERLNKWVDFLSAGSATTALVAAWSWARQAKNPVATKNAIGALGRERMHHPTGNAQFVRSATWTPAPRPTDPLHVDVRLRKAWIDAQSHELREAAEWASSAIEIPTHEAFRRSLVESFDELLAGLAPGEKLALVTVGKDKSGSWASRIVLEDRPNAPVVGVFCDRRDDLTALARALRSEHGNVRLVFVDDASFSGSQVAHGRERALSALNSAGIDTSMLEVAFVLPWSTARARARIADGTPVHQARIFGGHRVPSIVELLERTAVPERRDAIERGLRELASRGGAPFEEAVLFAFEHKRPDNLLAAVRDGATSSDLIQFLVGGRPPYLV